MNLIYLVPDTIPDTAEAIKIRNVQNPYIMRVYEVKNYKETLYKIHERLLNFMKTNDFLKGTYNEKDARNGDVSFTVAFEL